MENFPCLCLIVSILVYDFHIPAYGNTRVYATFPSVKEKFLYVYGTFKSMEEKPYFCMRYLRLVFRLIFIHFIEE